MIALVIVEYEQGKLNPATLSAFTAASLMAKSVKACVLGEAGDEVINILKKIEVIDEVFVLKKSNYNFLAEPCADAMVKLYEHLTSLNEGAKQEQPISHILVAATTMGKNLLPRIAAKLNTSQISDVIKVVDKNSYQRPIYAGNALATVKSNDALQLVTIRPTAFLPAEIAQNQAKVTYLDIEVDNVHSVFVGSQSQPSEKPKLSTAEIVISGGRGLEDAENFARLARIAERLKAALGASRAAVDAGLAPNELQVGQTGQIVAPKLYIAVGISGALQHLAGMKDSKVIVAINKDPNAPIFQVADYGLVADIKDVLQEWEAMFEPKGST